MMFANANVMSLVALWMDNAMKLSSLLTSLADSAIHFPNDIAILTDTAAWSYTELSNW